MNDGKHQQNSSVHARLGQSDFMTAPTLPTFGCHPLHIREEQTRFGKIFREILGQCRFPFSLQPTHVFTSPVFMGDLGLASDTVFWAKTVTDCMASQLSRTVWWKEVKDSGGEHTYRLEEWKRLAEQLPARCDFWHANMQAQLYEKRQYKNLLYMKAGSEPSNPLCIYMAPVSRMQCLAMMFPPFLPPDTFAYDPVPNLVHQMLWNLDPGRAGKLCTVYAPDQLCLVANRSRAFVLARGGILTGLPGRRTEPDAYLSSPYDPTPPTKVDGWDGLITLLHTLLYAEASDKMRDRPREFYSVLDGLVHTIINRVLYTDAAADAKSQHHRSTRQGAVFPSILPAKIANPAFQKLYDELRARYDVVTSHVAASVGHLQDVLVRRIEVADAMPMIKHAMSHADLACSYRQHPSFLGVGVVLQLRGYEVISIDSAYELLLRRLYVSAADKLYRLAHGGDSGMDTTSDSKQQIGNKGTDVVCLLISDTQASDLHDSISMTCGESAFLVAASWFDPACPESATRALLVVTAETLWRYQRLAFVNSYLPRVFAAKGALAKSPLSSKTQPGNADGKEWMRFSHAPIVEQMLLAPQTMIDGIEILRKWMGLGGCKVEDFAKMKEVTAACCKLFHYFVSYLRSDDDPGSEASLTDQRLQKVVNRLRVLFAYAESDVLVFPASQAVCFIGMITGKSMHLCEHPTYVTVSQQVLNESARKDEKGNVRLEHKPLMLFLGAIYASGDESAFAAMVDLIDSGSVTSVGDGYGADPGVDGDTAYSLESLRQQLDRRRPVDKYEFSAALCVCNRSVFAANIAHLASFVERLYYRPAPAVAERVHQNMTEILRLRAEVHCCPATFDLPVAWFRSSNGTSDVHVRTRLPLFENVITDETDAPRSLHFIMMSMSERPVNEKLESCFYSDGDNKREQALHWRDRSDRVPRIGAVRQPKPVQFHLDAQEIKAPEVKEPAPAPATAAFVPPPEAKAPEPVPAVHQGVGDPARDPRIYTFLRQQQQQQQQQEEEKAQQPMEPEPQQQQQQPMESEPQQQPAPEPQAQDDFADLPEASATINTDADLAADSDSSEDEHWLRKEDKNAETAQQSEKKDELATGSIDERKAASRSRSRSPRRQRGRSVPRRSKSRPRRSRSRSPVRTRNTSHNAKTYGTEIRYKEYQKQYQTSKDEIKRRVKQRADAERERQRERSAERREAERKRDEEDRRRDAELRAERDAARELRDRQANNRKSSTALMDTDAILQSLPTSYTPLASRKKK